MAIGNNQTAPKATKPNMSATVDVIAFMLPFESLTVPSMLTKEYFRFAITDIRTWSVGRKWHYIFVYVFAFFAGIEKPELK